MQDTYTYVARSVQDPNRVATFTLHDERMLVDMGGLEHIDRALIGEEVQAEDGGNGHEAPRERQTPWLKPAATWVMQRITEPVNVADVEAQVDGGGLTVRMWKRAGGLRLAPVTFKWQAVDNPQAAESFVDEVNERHQKVSHPGNFNGLLDYWVVWLAGLLGFGILLWQQRKGSQKPSAA